jgi:hypothetical protein
MSFSSESSTSSDLAIAFGPATAMAGQSVAKSLLSQMRVVSAMIEYTYTGTTQNDSGVAVSTKYSYFGGSPSTIANIYNDPNSEQYPLRNGGRILWWPTNTIEAVTFSNVTTTIGSNGILILHISGGAAGATITCRLVTNLEGLVSSDNTNLTGIAPSPTNANHWHAAWEWINTATNKIVPLFGGWNGAINAAAQFAFNRYLGVNQRRQLRLLQ